MCVLLCVVWREEEDLRCWSTGFFYLFLETGSLIGLELGHIGWAN